MASDTQPGTTIEYQVSAGGVVCRATDGNLLEVVLCGNTTPRLWALPKGGPDEGETMEETALREVREETGLEVSIDSPLGTTEYSFLRTQDSVRCYKTVHFFLMAPTGGDFSLHDPEFEMVQWFTEDKVLEVMTHSGEVTIVQRGLALARSHLVSS